MDSIYHAIPSYKRDDEQHTLELLESFGVDKSRIVLSVQGDEELSRYSKYKERVGKLICSDAKNVAQNRNAILGTLPVGSRVVMYDDDIRSFQKVQNNKLTDINGDEFRRMLQAGFAQCDIHKTVIWGIYPAVNKGWMKGTISRWSLIEGTLFGMVNNGLKFREDFAIKEDFELSCRVLKLYGKTVRLNSVVAVAKHRSRGGCEQDWLRLEEFYVKIMKEHSDLLMPNKSRKHEVLLKRKKR